jgi:Alpha-L-fucosidase
VEELLTCYGPISELWFDMGSLTPSQSKELYDLVHSLQPDCMVSGRLGNNQYDFCVMADNSFPDGTLKTAWQAPASMFNETWGYRSWQERGDVNVKAAKKLRSLVGTVAHGGNYLLNIGPKGDGSIVEFERNVLLKVGRWLKDNAEAIYDTEPFSWPGLGEKIFTTRKGNKIFLIPSEVPADTTVFINTGKAGLVSSSILSSGRKVDASIKSGKLRLTIPATKRTDFMDVICLTFDRPPVESQDGIIKASSTSGLVLSSKNAIESNSYSCFDYYTNYKSVTGYEWNFSGISGDSLEMSYTEEYVGKAITVEVDGQPYTITLTDCSPAHLEEVEASYGPTYYSIRSGSFSRDIPRKIFDLSTTEWDVTESSFLEKVPLNSTIYVAREITVGDDCEQIIEFTSSSGTEVLINGNPVLKHLNQYGEGNRRELLRAHLTKGKNQILAGTFNKWSREVPVSIKPADNIIYKTAIPLKSRISKNSVHKIRLSQHEGYNPHADIELSNIEIRVR